MAYTGHAQVRDESSGLLVFRQMPEPTHQEVERRKRLVLPIMAMRASGAMIALWVAGRTRQVAI